MFLCNCRKSLQQICNTSFTSKGVCKICIFICTSYSAMSKYMLILITLCIIFFNSIFILYLYGWLWIKTATFSRKFAVWYLGLSSRSSKTARGVAMRQAGPGLLRRQKQICSRNTILNIIGPIRVPCTPCY